MAGCKAGAEGCCHLQVEAQSRPAAKQRGAGGLGAGGRRRQRGWLAGAHCAALQLADEPDIDVHGAWQPPARCSRSGSAGRVWGWGPAASLALAMIRAQCEIAAMGSRLPLRAARRMHGTVLRLLLPPGGHAGWGPADGTIHRNCICNRQRTGNLHQLRSRAPGSRPGAGSRAFRVPPARHRCSSPLPGRGGPVGWRMHGAAASMTVLAGLPGLVRLLQPTSNTDTAHCARHRSQGPANEPLRRRRRSCLPRPLLIVSPPPPLGCTGFVPWRALTRSAVAMWGAWPR